MELTSWFLGMLIGTAMLAAYEPAPAGDLYDIDPKGLAEIWEKEHVSPADPYSLKHVDLIERLRRFAAEYPEISRLDKAGTSVEGRDIMLLSLGHGPQKILLWSQMHGDEPTATSSLLDIAYFLARHPQDPWVAGILERYTLLCVPMLNPDGAQKMQRRNAQGIDINRDARVLQTAEGKILKELRDRHTPFLGFNLHNQNSLTTVGDTGKVATIALLAVASDKAPEKTEDGSHPPFLAKQVTAVLYDALAPFVYGHISRYDEGFNPRAFGDNLTLWGTPVVLVESGGNPSGQPANFGVKLNFVGLLAALNSLATGKIQNANPAVFDALKMNSDTPIFDLLLRNAWICNGTGAPLFQGDVAIRRDVRSGAAGDALIADIGDLGVFTAHETIDCAGGLLTPGLIAWEPQGSPLAADRDWGSYVRQGILTVLDTVSWDEIARNKPLADQWKKDSRAVNWSFVLAGDPPAGAENGMRMAEWLAAGARAWLRSSEQSAQSQIPTWFGVEALTLDTMARYRPPSPLAGNPTQVLPRWTSDAARQFRLQRRGTIAVGSLADLVLWMPDSGVVPNELARCRPVRAIINGHPVDPGESASFGRFLGRDPR